MQRGKLKVSLGLFIGILLLAFSSSHPTTGTGGYTTAPGDSVCTVCHSNQSGTIDGNVAITGLPTVIDPNTTYPITVTSTYTAGTAFRAGFQIVALDQLNTGTGSISGVPGNAQLKTVNGKDYVGHQPAQNFGANTSVSWTYNWTSPAGPNNDVITFYAVSMLANNANGNSGDKLVVSNTQGTLITGGGALDVSITSSTDASCHNISDGSATAMATGGTPNYSYLWDNGENQATATMLGPGLHTVTVTDAVNATATSQVTINAPTALTGGIATQSDVTCFGDSDGSATIGAAGGTPSYSYNWPGGLTGPTQTGLASGNYIITVTDFNSCSTTVNLTINEPAAIDLSNAATTDVSCNGDANGSISVFPQGGTMPYFYNWSNGQSTNVIGNLMAGNYTITVSDFNGCTAESSFSINEPEALMITPTFVGDVTCAGLTNGAITVLATGGTGSYTYNWSNGGTGASQMNLGEGTYVVSVTDDNNCESTLSIPVDVLSPEIIITVDQVTNVSCGAVNDGAIDISVSGGDGNFSYLWSNSDLTEDISMLQASTYTVTVSDGNGCSATASATVNQNQIDINLEASSNLTCFESNDGSLEVSASGGQEPYSFMWSNGESTAAINDIPSDVYTVTVSDVSGCSTTMQFMVTQPNPLEVSTAISDVTCFGGDDGSVDLNISGGTSPYTVDWDNGLVGFPQSDLEAGTYLISVTDANECLTTAEVVINEPAEITLEVISSTPVTCAGIADGAIEVSASGGTGTLSYEWPGGSTSPNQTNMAGGAYQISVTDDNACEVIFTVTIEEPDPFLPNATSTAVSSEGAMDGTARVDPAGGTEPYTYMWSNGGDAQEIIGLAQGRYYVTVTDMMGCIAMQSVVVSRHDCSLNSSLMISNVSCNGAADGFITVEITGASEALTYQWSDGSDSATASDLVGGIYSVTVQEGDLCQLVISNLFLIEPNPIEAQTFVIESPQCEDDMTGSLVVEIVGGSGGNLIEWSTGATSDIIENLGVGTYSVTIEDMNACVDSATIELGFMDTTPPEIDLADVTVSLDSDGTFELTPGIIDLGSTDNCTEVTHTLSKSTFTCEDLGMSGTTVTSSDEAGNEVTSKVIVTVVDLEAPVFECPASINVMACNAVTYDLPVATDNCEVVSLDLVTGLSSGEIFPIGGTTIRYEARDISGNVGFCEFVVFVDATINVTEEITDPSCPGLADGSITLNISATNEPVDVNLIDIADPSALSAGTYMYQIVDNGECEITNSFEITDPVAISLLDTIITNASSMSAMDGSINFTPMGGTGNLAFIWRDVIGNVVSNNQLLEAVGVGTYTLEIIDDNNCSMIFGPFIVSAPSSSDDEILNAQLTIYPNPTASFVTIQNDSELAIRDITINSADGRLVKTIPGNGSDIYKIDMTDFVSGIYLIKINSAQGSALKRIMKR